MSRGKKIAPIIAILKKKKTCSQCFICTAEHFLENIDMIDWQKGNQRKRLEAEIMTKGKVLEGHLLTFDGLVTFKIITDLLDLNQSSQVRKGKVLV